MSKKIQIKRGLKANLPILDAGEPAFTTDTKEFFVGDGKNNIEFAKQADLEVINSQVSDLNFQTAGGTGTSITLKINQIMTNGLAVTFIASTNNSGAATTINGKPLYKPNTKTVPNLMAGKAYTVWYNSTGDCFFIKASAEGDADVSHVLATKKFSNDNDTGLTGTMPNNGAVSSTLTNNNQEYTIPAGFHNGLGKIKTIITNLAAAVIKAGTTVGGIVGTFTSDATAVAADIINGKTAYVNGNKITGNATIQNLGGLQAVHGSGVIYTRGATVDIGAQPKYIIATCVDSSQTWKEIWTYDSYTGITTLTSYRTNTAAEMYINNSNYLNVSSTGFTIDSYGANSFIYTCLY